MLSRPIASYVGALMLIFAGAACSSSSGSATKVESTNTTCTADQTSFKAGRHSFEVTNKGDKATELYVLKGDSVLSEVENVGPGTSRTLTVNLPAGSYDLGCKPGQSGPFIREPIKVTGAGGTDKEQGADREIDIKAIDYKFSLDPSGIKAGQRIEFKMTNDGAKEHEFEVLSPDGKAVGEIAPIQPGKSGTAILPFDISGTYTYVCAIDDHEARGMKGKFIVG